MAKKISGSVGKGGKNARVDTETVQNLINASLTEIPTVKKLETDGKVGNLTIGAITEFQRRVVKLSVPDGRVDPGGKTISKLNGGGTQPGYTPPMFNSPNTTGNTPILVPTPIPPSGSIPTIDTGGNLSPERTVTTVEYTEGLAMWRRIVNAYTFQVVHMILRNAGMPHTVISSTIRSPQIQAETMYPNAVANLENQYGLYGVSGDKVLDVFAANRDKPRAEVVALMVAKIVEIQGYGGIVSRHCVSEGSYRRRNIIDLSIRQTRERCGALYNEAAMENAIRQAERDGYVAKFVDESHLSNHCWHLEIIPNAKAIV